MLMSTLLADMPDLCHRVLTTHVKDRHGRCRECEGVRWPCALHRIAHEAELLARPRLRNLRMRSRPPATGRRRSRSLTPHMG